MKRDSTTEMMKLLKWRNASATTITYHRKIDQRHAPSIRGNNSRNWNNKTGSATKLKRYYSLYKLESRYRDSNFNNRKHTFNPPLHYGSFSELWPSESRSLKANDRLQINASQTPCPRCSFPGSYIKMRKEERAEEKKEVEKTRLSLRDRHRRHLTIINMTHNNNTTHET